MRSISSRGTIDLSSYFIRLIKLRKNRSNFANKLFIIFPRREMRSISSRGSIDFSSYFICLSKRTSKKKVTVVVGFLPSFFLEKFYPPKGDA